ncbi:hypothetical protein D3C71_1180030 [compost metagenome]
MHFPFVHVFAHKTIKGLRILPIVKFIAEIGIINQSIVRFIVIESITVLLNKTQLAPKTERCKRRRPVYVGSECVDFNILFILIKISNLTCRFIISITIESITFKIRHIIPIVVQKISIQ